MGNNCIISENSTIGNNVILHNNVVVEKNCTIGDNTIIQSGTVIGSDGFGTVVEDGVFEKSLGENDSEDGGISGPMPMII